MRNLTKNRYKANYPPPFTKFYIFFSLLVLAVFCATSIGKEKVCIPKEELKVIGELIFINEGSGKVENLTTWNEGEEFASLGIGHFLWYPQGKEYRFVETFPEVLSFLASEGAPLPEWIKEMPEPELPWNSRQEFYDDFDSTRMVSLRNFLLDTVALQTLFMAGRLERGLPKILDAAPKEDREHIKTQFYRVANSPMGMYVLIDYVNFKGEGIAPSESYNGMGWGLLQVLTEMNGKDSGASALEEFSDKAEFVLLRRVKNSPPDRGEKRWIPGWKNRIKTYTDPKYKSLITTRDDFCK